MVPISMSSVLHFKGKVCCVHGTSLRSSTDPTFKAPFSRNQMLSPLLLTPRDFAHRKAPCNGDNWQSSFEVEKTKSKYPKERA